MWCQSADVIESPPIAEEIERYLLTGESDPLYSAWSGSFLERANRAHDDLRGALVRAVRRLTKGLAHEPLPETDTVALTRAKVEPMVRGLFPRAEQDAVLATLEQSVVFVTSANIERLLHGAVSTARRGRWRTCTSQALARSCLRRTRPALSG